MNDRLPPNSLEAEQGVLACVLLSPQECMQECLARFKGSGAVFYDLRHRHLWEVLHDMHRKGQAVDTLTLFSELRTRELLDKVGGYEYASAMADKTPSAANLRFYLDILLEKFTLRRAMAECGQFVRDAYEHTGDLDGLLGKFEDKIESLITGWTQSTGERGPEELKLPTAFEKEYEAEWNHTKANPPGRDLPFPLADFRVRTSELTVVVGDSESGKSTWMGEVLICLAKQGARVCVASMEMPKGKLLYLLSRQILGVRHLPEGEGGKKLMWEAFGFMERSFVLFDYLGIANWRQILDAFIHAREKLNCDVFLIDNLGMIGIAEDDMEGQAAAAAQLATFAHMRGLHLFCVHHTNKGDGAFKNRVRGNKRWTDFADNAIEWLRNDRKAEEHAELAEKLRSKEITEEDYTAERGKLASKWDAKCILRKHRWGERRDASRYLWFNWEAKQFHDKADQAPINYLL